MKKSGWILFFIVVLFCCGGCSHKRCDVNFFPRGNSEYMEISHPDNPNKTCGLRTIVEVQF